MGNSIQTRILIILKLLVVATLSACAAAPPSVSRSEAFAAVLSWLDCDECYNGQYEYLISLGQQREVKAALQEAIDDDGRFADIYKTRRASINDEAIRIAEVRLGLDTPERIRLYSTADRRKRVDDLAEKITEVYLKREKSRHKRRAAKALKNLSWRKPPKSSVTENRGG